MFITSLAAYEKAPTFENMASIVLQEEERRKIFNCGSQHLDLALLEKWKQPYEEKNGTKIRAVNHHVENHIKVWHHPKQMLMVKRMMHVFTVESLDNILEIVGKISLMSPSIKIEGTLVTFFVKDK